MAGAVQVEANLQEQLNDHLHLCVCARRTHAHTHARTHNLTYIHTQTHRNAQAVAIGESLPKKQLI